MDSFTEAIANVEALFEETTTETKPELAIKLLKLENANLEKTIICLRGHNAQVEADNEKLRKENKNMKQELKESKTVLANLLKQIKKYENALKKELCINTSSAYYEHNGELYRKDSSSRSFNSTSSNSSNTSIDS